MIPNTSWKKYTGIGSNLENNKQRSPFQMCGKGTVERLGSDKRSPTERE
ncbi:hypothetical protein CKA32_001980 [Geitlerinema sp. FC II]|nr:hypothetical protein CKA32_001980 [Geitlerinema sp. FC II]